MKLQGFKKYLVVLLLLGFSGSSWAVIYTLPATLTPPSWVDEVGDDINGTGLFTPGASILTFELFDLGEETPLIPGIEFGYYSASDAADGSLEASDLNTIFAHDNSANGPVTVNFGTVAPIGFYVRALSTTVATQERLNALGTARDSDGGTDFAGVFPVTGVFPPPLPDGTPLIDAYLIGFVYPRPFPLVGESLIYASAFARPPNLSPIPVPGAIFLWLTGLAGLALFRRSLASNRPVTATAAR